MLQAISYHPHVHGADRQEHSRCRCRASTASPRWPITTVLQTVWTASRESLAAYRDYERLRSRGESHDAALCQALAIGPARTTRATVKSLHVAGRA
jgi:predicted metalloprotease with PDZ domain